MVEIYDDRISIVSPGGVPRGITEKNFGKRSITRNPIIADLLARTHYIEKSGTGIRRMMEDMKEAGLKEPIFQYDDFFEVEFLRPSYYDKKYGTYDLSSVNNILEGIHLTNTQEKILQLVKNNPNITQKEMAMKIEVALPTIKKNIQILKEQEILLREGATKNGIWKVKDNF